MKKWLLVLAPLLFFIAFPPVQYASESTPSALVSPTPVVSDYVLPYPGLLPDSPLYSLKVFRDRIVGFFISDPLKKSEFDLLQADKRLQAAAYLQKKGQPAGRQGSSEDMLVGSTLSKGENYFDESLAYLKTAKGMGENIDPQLTRLQSSVRKHTQTIHDMMLGASPTLQATLTKEATRVSEFSKVVASLGK